MSNLLPFQRVNIGILIGMLVALPAKQYNHDDIGFGFDGADPEVGCAIGLAFRNSRVFKVPGENGSMVSADTLGLYPFGFATAAFGDTLLDIFGSHAFRPLPPHEVTKEMVIERLEQLLQAAV